MAVYHIESITIRDKSVIPVRVQYPATIDYQSTHEVTGDQEVMHYTGDVLGIDQSTQFLRMRMEDGTTLQLRNSDIISVFQEKEPEIGSTIYWGASLVPPPNIGKVTDVYIAKNGDCYALTETGWKLQTNIRGPVGPPGSSPKIGTNGNWFLNGKDTGVPVRGDAGRDGASPVIDPTTKHWFLKGVDLGVCAEGHTPYIGTNGNWWIGTTDTGVTASGSSLLPVIDPTTKHWIVDGKDTGIIAEGHDGKTPYIDPTTKHWFINGTDTGVVAEGIGGSISLTINTTTNNWEVDGVDTGVSATGPCGPAGAPGKDGESFQLFAVYETETEMDADEPNIPENSFVALITATNVLLFIKSDGYIPDATAAPDSRNNFIWIKNLTDMISIAGLPGKDGVTPHIDAVSGHWMIGTTDTGVNAIPPIPYIGANSNWWIGTTDTGKSALGSSGITPTIDPTTKHWMLGTTDTGVVAEASLPTIDPATKHWVVNGTDTGISAVGTDGLTPYIGGNGHWFIGATDTGVNASGAFPVIDATTGNWFVDGADTGVSATGPAGKAPVVSIDPTTKNWLIDGADTGMSSVGADGKIPVIGVNGNWWIDGTDLGVQAQGSDGVTPTIDPTTKHWMLGTTDTGVVAEGAVDTAELQVLKNRMNSLIASKHSLGSTDFFFCYSNNPGSSYLSPSIDSSLLTILGDRKSNMQINGDYVTLKANRVYHITADMMVSSGSYRWALFDKAGTMIDGSRGGSGDEHGWSSVASNCIVCTEEDTEVSIKFIERNGSAKIAPSWAYVYIEELNNPRDIDPIEYIMSEEGIEDTPVGAIVSYMGTTIPKHYLLCDGSVLNIDDYPDLAAHFVEEFGAAEHFGGDGLTTFAVPDLRNEFLRGYHGDAAEQLSGEIGEHQDATEHPHIVASGAGDVYYSGYKSSTEVSNIKNPDTRISAGNPSKQQVVNTTNVSNVNNQNLRYTARPTNTAVLYCIKYESTPFVQINSKIVGVEVDEEIFSQLFTDGQTGSYPFTTSVDEYDELWIGVFNDSATATLLVEKVVPTMYLPKPVTLHYNNPKTNTTISGGRSIVVMIDNSELSIMEMSLNGNVGARIVIRGRKYAKVNNTTQGTGTVEIDPDPDNAIEERPNGIFVPKGLEVSEEADNELEMKPDGIYVGSHNDLRRRINQLHASNGTRKDTDWLYATVQNNPSLTATFKAGVTILQLLTDRIGNLIITGDGYVRLRPNKTYKVTVGALTNDNGSGCTFYICNRGGTVYGNTGRVSNTYTDNIASAVIETGDSDMDVTCTVGTGSAAIHVGFSFMMVEEFGSLTEIDPVAWKMEEDGIEDNPVGTIVPFMGNTPAKHYLACDGAEYNIIDYPYLADHFLNEFGTVNHFGGDGIDTFAVPDLRNEFLRGYHGDKDEQLSGEIGVHQDATQIPKISAGVNGTTKYIQAYPYNNGVERVTDPDREINTSKNYLNLTGGQTGTHNSTYAATITTRPTNVAVLWMIKAEPTPFVQTCNSVLAVDLDEVIYDGEPSVTDPNTFLKSLNNYDTISIVVANLSNTLMVQKEFSVAELLAGNDVNMDTIGSSSSSSVNTRRVNFAVTSDTTFSMAQTNTYANGGIRLLITGRKYVKTEDIQKPLSVKTNEVFFEQNVMSGNSYALSVDPKELYDVIIAESVVMDDIFTGMVSGHVEFYVDKSTSDIKMFISSTGFKTISSGYGWTCHFKITGKTLTVDRLSSVEYGSDPILRLRGIKYAPVTLENGGGISDISSEEGNIIVEKADGIYAAEPEISKEENNVLEKKEDGLFVAPAKVSAEEGNELIEKPDGLFVESHNDLRKRINRIYTGKYGVIGEPGYFQVHRQLNPTETEAINITTGQNILSKYSKYDTNMEVDAGVVKLLGGHKYRLTANLFISGINAECVFVNHSGKEIGSRCYATRTTDGDPLPSGESLNVIYEPEADIGVWLKLSATYPANATGSLRKAYTSVVIEEIEQFREIDPVEYLVKENGIEDVTIGSIMPFMGPVAPKHYLICDGTEYNIADWPHLAEHFRVAFGTTNYFGGDGVDTFKVPDLRNEFLRGYHGDATEQLSGEIGEHQDGTEFPDIRADTSGSCFFSGYDGNTNVANTKNYDTVIPANANSSNQQLVETTRLTRSGLQYTRYTSRPMNTAVVYVIKAESTPFVQVTKNAMAVSMNDILLSAQTLAANGTYTLEHPLSQYDVVTFTLKTGVHILKEYNIPADDILDGSSIDLSYVRPSSNTTIEVGRRIQITVNDLTLTVTHFNLNGNNAVTLTVRGIKYVDLPEGVFGTVSSEDGNLLEEKADGLYMKEFVPTVSKDENNALSTGSDGNLYVPAAVVYEDEEITQAVMDIFYPEKSMLANAKSKTPKTLEYEEI